MPEPSAEIAYLFRHALLRDAAYDLQPPATRAHLHGLAVQLLEQFHGGRAPMPDLTPPAAHSFTPHRTDGIASELAAHARLAVQAGGDPDLDEPLRVYHCRAAQVAEQAYGHAEALSAWQRAAALFPDSRRGECLRRAANSALRLMRPEQAEQLHVAALDLAVECDDVGLEAAVRGSRTVLLYQLARLEECDREGALALELLQRAGDRRGEAAVLSALGSRYVARSDFERGEAFNIRAREIARETGFGKLDAAVTVNLGNLRSFQHRWQEAEELDREGLALARALNTRDIEAQALMNLAEVFQNTGRLEQAESHLRAAVELARETGQPMVLAYGLSELGRLLMSLGLAPEAEPLLRDAIAVGLETSGNVVFAADQCRLALCLLSQGRRDEAAALWGESIGVIRARGRAASLQRMQDEMSEHCRRFGLLPLQAEEPPTPP